MAKATVPLLAPTLRGLGLTVALGYTPTTRQIWRKKKKILCFWRSLTERYLRRKNFTEKTLIKLTEFWTTVTVATTPTSIYAHTLELLPLFDSSWRSMPAWKQTYWRLALM